MKYTLNAIFYRCWCSLVATAVVSVALVGCGGSAGSIPVNQSAAREACQAFLEAWKGGKTTEELKPKISGADYVWASGQKLVSFEILPEEINNGTSLRVSTLLVLKDSKGRESKSNVSYTVGTSPVITVIRDEPDR